MTNRTYKFRAWDNIAKMWIQVKWGCDIDNSGALYSAETQPKTELVLMQFTGLLDKNGKEIWEGDILKTESGICEVKWYDKGACFRWMFEGNSESPLNYDDKEIIGSIYENPDLLTPSNSISV